MDFMTGLGDGIKKLGFGLMRLPQKDGGIDIDQTKVMVDMFMDSGFTYFDTAWAYPGSEDAVRQAIVERYPRDRFLLATKLSAWRVRTKEDAEKQFETSLERTGAGYFDFYLLHNLGRYRTHYFDDFDIWNFAQEKKREGKVKHVGFSFHSDAEELEKILRTHPEMEFVQLQLNYGDWESTEVQSRRIYEVARKYDKPIIVMEPVKGGLLADPPDKVAEILKKADPEASCASWAIRFAASLEGVMVVLSGMSDIAQMEDNLSYMKDFRPLDDDELRTVHEARKMLESIPIIPCTNCRYCIKECPKDIGIPGTLNAMNLLILFDNLKRAQLSEDFNVAMSGSGRAYDCIKCGRCESVCPQQIPIRQRLEEAVVKLELKKKE